MTRIFIVLFVCLKACFLSARVFDNQSDVMFKFEVVLKYGRYRNVNKYKSKYLCQNKFLVEFV